jgi:V/A-type H+-transporting ATPase subunit A
MGKITRVTGPLVEAKGMRGQSMYDVVYAGKEKLIGEIIKIEGERASIQVYEDTTGLMPGEPVEGTGKPLSVELGPGLLAMIYDGIQRPLEVIKNEVGDFILRGSEAPALDRRKVWDFKPAVAKNDKVVGGTILGEVQETDIITHRILAPPATEGTVLEIHEGKHTIEDTVCMLNGKKELKLYHTWPVKKPRPTARRLDAETPLVTGQRVLDTFFPLAKGGTAGIPGPFGSGKTITQHQLAKWADADVIVYVGCGERGNEMTEVIDEFPKLSDPKSGKPLMMRTVLIANTSNMPVAAREASIYTGITLAEYFRDMGYDAALMADSTSRWAEALREMSGRLEEMPGEEGYPAYLSERLSAFYERAGRAVCLGNDREGSTSIIGAVSPPGGDFSEPVTQNTLRIVRVFWGLDARLADRRHFPSVNWFKSYSLYFEPLKNWYEKNVGADFAEKRDEALTLLAREAELMEIVQLVGSEALPPAERLVLEVAKMIREDFLQQNAYHEVDTYCSLGKQYKMLSAILSFYEKASVTLDGGKTVESIISSPVVGGIAKMKYTPEKEFQKMFEGIVRNLEVL